MRSLGIVRGRTGLWLLPLTSLIAVLPLLPAPVWAQTSAKQPTQPTRNFDIRSSQLSESIVAFADQAGVQIAVNSQEVRGIPSHRVIGRYSREDALRRLVGNAPVTTRWTGPNTLAVRADPSAQRPVRPTPVALQAPFSEDAASQNPSGEEIVVTAQGREQRLQDVPISVAAASGTFLQKSNITTLEQLSTQMSGVKIAQAPASDQLHIRGTGSGLNSGFEQSVATFVDGVYRGRARSSRAALFDVERVEVLKGPQTTFFGNNAIAGAFNITTRKSGADFRYNATALYSPSDGEYNLEAGVDLPVSDALSVRLAGRASGMDGYVRNTKFRRDEPHLRDAIGRVNVVWKPSVSFTSNLRVDVIRNRDRGTYAIELLNCPVPAAYGSPRGQCAAYLAASGGSVDDKLDYRTSIGDSFFHYDATEVSFNNDINISGATLSSKSSYFHHDVFNFSNLIPVPVNGIFGTTTAFPISAPERLTQYTQEVRLTSQAGKKLEYIIGAYYLHGNLLTRSDAGYFFAPFGNIAGNGFPLNTPVTTISFTRQQERSMSLFGSATFNFSDYFRLSGGIRYSRVRKTGNRQQQAGSSSGGPDFKNFVPALPAAQRAVLALLGTTTANYADRKRTDDAFLPSATLQYDVAPDVMIYGSYSKGFKAGGFSGFTADTFKPEKVDAYELGLKSRLFDRALTFNLALFMSNYSNLQEASQVLTNGGASTAAIVGNSAKSRSKGMELGAILRLSDAVSFRGDVAYLDARYTDFRNASCTVLAALTPNCIQNLSGRRRAYAPEWSGSVGMTITAPIRNAELRLEPTVGFSSSYLQQNFDPLYTQPRYAKFDLRIGIGDRASGWELAVLAKNLTDKATASFRNNVPSSPGAVLALPDRPRSVAIQFSIQ